jgi:hypothetical protein
MGTKGRNGRCEWLLVGSDNHEFVNNWRRRKWQRINKSTTSFHNRIPG